MLRKITLLAATLGLLLGAAAAPALANTAEEPANVHWDFEGPFGRYGKAENQAQLQRGYKVYREVCSSCHSMKLVSFRNLGDPGGPFWNPKYKNPNDNPVVKAIAADYQVDDIDTDTGDTTKRPGIPADRFPSPFANDYAAKASNGGANPPDMSLLARAREGQGRYIFSILMGYENPPAGVTLNPGQHYNKYMAGGVIAMPPPLKAGQVTYDDGTPSSLEQEAMDVSAFLMWAADPHADDRKNTGIAVLIYLLLFSGLLYLAYRQVWKNESH
ncbi:ubiquinol-cytochrome c reductase cytochrome c1 subunit [Caulobacter ginsengisoli]|uniref:Cytochrome c1 n=1 Tax=Caulobacter ginsengisoli TaxID=400775 RepID=A0ABU0IYA1_9CAUL|nr:cytochrome c1 [Caulobacter ginsengisoli]MDQ0466034.1 ubiquinol-cytochrome c reductase cytochrome c1 subunit [Caulobacter ginsengisoli]